MFEEDILILRIKAPKINKFKASFVPDNRVDKENYEIYQLSLLCTYQVSNEIRLP